MLLTPATAVTHLRNKRLEIIRLSHNITLEGTVMTKIDLGRRALHLTISMIGDNLHGGTMNDTITTIVIVTLITTNLISGLVTAKRTLVQTVITKSQTITNLMGLTVAPYATNVTTLWMNVILILSLGTVNQTFPNVTTTGLETETIVDHETVQITKKTS